MSDISQSKTDTSTTKTVGDDAGKTQAKTQTQHTGTEDLQAQLEAAEKRIRELNHESQTRRERLEAFEAAEQKRQEEELSATDRLKKRDEELEQLKASFEATAKELEERNQVLEKQYEATVKSLKVPDYVQALLNDKPVSDRLNILNEYRGEFKPAHGVDLGAGKSGKSRKVVSIDDLDGMTPEQINEAWPDLLKQQQ